jgi:hypothetical protein
MSEARSSELSPRLLDLLDSCNRTELYQLCKHAGLNPKPNAPREILIRSFIGEIEPEREINDLDLWRRGLKGFVQERWAVLEPQITCPIRQDINACTSCLDAQVVACVVEQKDQEPLIQLHRK